MIRSPDDQPANDKQAVLERLWVRNAIRRELGIRPLNVPKMYHRKIGIKAMQPSPPVWTIHQE